jgi:hypothetical protein
MKIGEVPGKIRSSETHIELRTTHCLLSSTSKNALLKLENGVGVGADSKLSAFHGVANSE